MKEFTTDEKTAMSRAFASGDYANAYESTDLETALEAFNAETDDDDTDAIIRFNRPDHERAAFVLGFFGSYSLDEIGSDREIFDECYWSDAGQYVVNVARYTDSRTEEYAEDEASNV
jgi:hypothetical protein